MSTFNEYFRKVGVGVMMKKFFTDIDRYSKNHKITDLKYEVMDDGDFQSSYYIENELTPSHKVVITYFLDGKDDQPYVTSFEVPREIDGCFILQGKYRIATAHLGKDNECRICLEGSGEHYINFDYNRKYSVTKKHLIVRRNTEYGVQEQVLNLAFDNIDEALSDPEKAEHLKLTERQSKKLLIKLDLEEAPKYITQDLIQKCLDFGDDRSKDLVIDKTIESVSKNFMQFLWKDGNGKNYRNARQLIMNHFSKYSVLPDPLNVITNVCLKFFRGAASKDGTKSELQMSPGINCLNLQSYSTKITLDASVAYNDTLADLIDLADTPINGNVGLQNSLTISCHPQDDGSILFDVMTKDFKKTSINYIDYLNSKVCASEYVDYERNQIKPDENGEVQVKYRMKRKMVKADEIDLIDLHPDYRLSTSSRQIPFINFTDSVRVMMGSAMLKQTIPLPNGQKPLVCSGNVEDLDSNTMNEHFNDEKGKVESIDEESIIIALPDGTKRKFLRRTAIQSLNNVDVFSEPKVKVGQTVKKGDIITGAHELDKEHGLKLGLNTLVLYGPHKGLTNEDAVVVSESYADRMSSYSFIDIFIDIRNSDALKWIAPIGTQVKSGEPVVTVNHALQLNDVNALLNDKLDGVLRDPRSKIIVEKKLDVPNNIDEATVSDVMIQEKDPMERKEKIDFTYARLSDQVIKDYEDAKDRKPIYDRFPEYIASDTLDPVSMSMKKDKTLYTIRVRLIKRQRLVCGSKLTNRYGGKGVISAIEPDEKMPIIVDGQGVQKRAEVILNPYSTIGRKIPSVIMEVGCANVIMKIHDLVEKYKVTATGKKKIMPLIKKYYPKYENMDVEDFLKLHNNKPLEEVYSMNVGSFSSYTPAKIQEMMDDLGVSTQSKVLYPSLDLMDLDELKDTLGQEEFDNLVESERGKFREVRKPLMAGYVTMIQLYHMPMYSNKCNTDNIDSNRHGIVAPRGAFRENGGQKLSEMDLQALLSRNARGFVKMSRADFEKQQNQEFLNHLLGLGLMITDSSGYPIGGSNLKSSLAKMKKKYKFRNGGVV
jgi:hypothetical protein